MLHVVLESTCPNDIWAKFRKSHLWYHHVDWSYPNLLPSRD